MDRYKNNPSKTKLHEHISPGLSLSAMMSFKDTGNKYDVYRGKDCMKKFCECLQQRARKIINFKKKKIKFLNSRNHMKMQKSAIFVGKKMKIKMLKTKNIQIF